MSVAIGGLGAESEVDSLPSTSGGIPPPAPPVPPVQHVAIGYRRRPRMPSIHDPPLGPERRFSMESATNVPNEGQVCQICLEPMTSDESGSTSQRPLPATTIFHPVCCDSWFCGACVEMTVKTQIEQTRKAAVKCPGLDCDSMMTADLVEQLAERVGGQTWEQFQSARRESAAVPKGFLKCPFCFHLTTKRRRTGELVACGGDCQGRFCGRCSSAPHEGLTCKQARSGRKQLFQWANTKPDKLNVQARQCPGCKSMIQRNGGCPEMTCNKCSTKFCYKCGRRYREYKLMPFLGNHHNGLSVFGCKSSVVFGFSFENHAIIRETTRVTILIVGLTIGVPLVVVLGPPVLLTVGIFLLARLAIRKWNTDHCRLPYCS